MKRSKIGTIMLWILYIAICICAAAMPIAEKVVRSKLTGKEEYNGRDNFVYYRRRADYRGI